MPSNLWALLGVVSSLSVKKYIDFLNIFKSGEVQSNKKLTYVSLFSGIGGFELGIEKVFPNAECVAFAEIDNKKLKVYQSNYPNHINIGDVFKISKQRLQSLQADLLVGGFSCTSKSSLSATRGETKKGTDYSQDTFEATLKIIKLGNYKDIILENVPTSTSSTLTTEKIAAELQKTVSKQVYVIKVNGINFTGTSRNRVFFATFPKKIEIPTIAKRFEFELEPYADLRYGFSQSKNATDESISLYIQERLKEKGITKFDLNPYEYRKHLVDFMTKEERTNRWSFPSDTNMNKSRAFTKKLGTYPNGLIIDRRGGDPLVRYMTIHEGERLMGFPEGWNKAVGPTVGLNLLGDAVVVPVIQYIMLNYLFDKSRSNFKTYKPYKRS